MKKALSRGVEVVGPNPRMGRGGTLKETGNRQIPLHLPHPVTNSFQYNGELSGSWRRKIACPFTTSSYQFVPIQ